MIKVFYHANCADGFASAYIAWQALCPRDNIEFIPMNYGNAPEYEAHDTVYILDFSFNTGIVIAMLNCDCDVILLDHHQTAENELKKLVDGKKIIFDQTKCGSRLTWEYFHPGERAPRIVDYIEDRDLWKWELPFSREISAAIGSYEKEFGVWQREIWNNSFEELVTEGQAILRYQNQIVENAARNAREINFLANAKIYKILAVNNPVCMSEIGEVLVNGIYKDKPFSVVYYQTKEGNWKYSLRSRADNSGEDVSVIAKSFGGGGHRNAAGFTSDVLFTLINI